MRLSIVFETSFSLPGIGVAEMMTVSPGTMPTLRWSDIDMRVNADIGSPWLPVVMMTICSMR